MAPSWAMFVVVTSSGLLFLLPFGLWLYLDGAISLPTLLLFLMLGSSPAICAICTDSSS
ncbi:hypothetical protein [Solidesulfovibrio alcoholivorans]|uniref:hypothetical protein n=1 Tax=Solidesulfovibrio alcoholivorans TaxID=81406 RepID=UPI00138E2020|nr:hypothetical protein [Solidesulfovibrio alcoholivorans]